MLLHPDTNPIYYIRVSSRDQANEGTSLESQLIQLKRFANEHSLPFDDKHVFTEAKPGRKNLLKRESQLEKAFNLAKETGQPFIVTRFDRLTRCKEVAEAFYDAGITIIESQNNDLITRNQAISYLNRCELERAKKIESNRRTLDAKKSKGERLGNPKIAQVQKRAVSTIKNQADEFAHAVYPEIKDLLNQGLSRTAIASYFNDSGKVTARGGKWSAATVGNILKRVESKNRLPTSETQEASTSSSSVEQSEYYKDWGAFS